MYTAAIESGVWDWKVGQPIEPLVGNTLGFVAFGKIQRTFARLASGFDFDYLVYDPYLEGYIEDDTIRTVGFETVLSESDIISIHAPLVEATHHMFDADAFRKMSDSAVLINTACGLLVDEDALYEALQNEEIAGAGFDVMADEPVHESPLFELDSVVVTPHVAWYSERSLDELRRKAAENVVRELSGEEPHGVVNRSTLSET